MGVKLSFPPVSVLQEVPYKRALVASVCVSVKMLMYVMACGEVCVSVTVSGCSIVSGKMKTKEFVLL